MPHLKLLVDLASEDLCPICSGSPHFIDLKQAAFDKEIFTNSEGNLSISLRDC